MNHILAQISIVGVTVVPFHMLPPLEAFQGRITQRVDVSYDHTTFFKICPRRHAWGVVNFLFMNRNNEKNIE